MTLKNITTATENKKSNAKQKHNIPFFENMGSHNFRLNTPPKSATFFTSINCVQFQRTFCFPRFQMITIQAKRSSGIKTVPMNMTSKKFLKKTSRLPIFNQMENYVCFTWESVSIIKNICCIGRL